jgi:hypothetical protein
MSDTPITDTLARFRYPLVHQRFVEEAECAKLERELNEAKQQATDFCKAWVESDADRLRLREALLSLVNSLTWRSDRPFPRHLEDYENHVDSAVSILDSKIPPPVVAKTDADALADAIEYTLKADAILHPETNHVGMRQALETYRSKYLQ